MDALQVFARNLRRERLARGLSQERLAELSNVHMTDVGRIERGERDPRLTTAEKLARGLGMPLSALIDASALSRPPHGGAIPFRPGEPRYDETASEVDPVAGGSSPATETPTFQPPDAA